MASEVAMCSRCGGRFDPAIKCPHPDALVQDWPSPVRASAQAQAEDLAARLDRLDWASHEPETILAAELLIAEARGRQQAEQVLCERCNMNPARICAGCHEFSERAQQAEQDRIYLSEEVLRLTKRIVETEDRLQQAEQARDSVTVWPPQDDPIEPYLKDGETPAECVARNRADVQTALSLLAKEKARVQQAEQELEKALVEHEADLLRIKELQSSIDGCAQRVQSLSSRAKQAEQARVSDAIKAAEASEAEQFRLGECFERVAALTQALKDAERFIANGIEFGYITMPDPDCPDSAHDTLPKIRAALTGAQA